MPAGRRMHNTEQEENRMLNSVILQGRMVADPEPRHTNSGVHLASFRVAVDRNTKTANGKREVDFINCTAWRATAEFVCRYFHKGDMILVQGRLQSHTWTTDSGDKRSNTDVVVDSVYFGGGRSGSGQAAPAAPAATATPAGFTVMPDDGDSLPF